MKTVVGLFDQFDDARRAVHDLRDAGFSNEDISMIANDEGGNYSRYLDADRSGTKEDVSDGAAAGAGLGAVLGGLGGLLVGLGALMIPGIGPVIAAGPIITTLAGAGVGAVAGGILGALVDLGIPEEHANYYAEGVRRGGTLVVLRADDARAEMAADIMNRYHPVDVDRRASDWRQQDDWQGFRSDDESYTHDRDRLHTSSAIPVTGSDIDDTDLDFDRGGMSDLGNEHLNRDVGLSDAGMGGQDYDRGGMTGQGYGGTGTTGIDDQDLNRSRMSDTGGMDYDSTDRSGLGGQGFNRSGMSDMDDPDFDRGTHRTDRDGFRSHDRDIDDDIPVTGGMRDVAYSDTAYSEDTQPMGRDWSYFDNEFRSDYQTRYGSMGQSYAYYQPAYRFGYDMANDSRYRDWDWDQVEPAARQEWEQRGLVGAWEDFKDAVRHAWNSVTR